MKPDLTEIECRYTLTGFSCLSVGNQLDQAEEAFNAALEENGSNVHARIGLAIVCRARGDLNNCIALLDQVLRVDPQNVYALFQRCISRVRQDGDTSFIEDILSLSKTATANTEPLVGILNLLATNVCLHLDVIVQSDVNALPKLLTTLNEAAKAGEPRARNSTIATLRFVFSLYLGKIRDAASLIQSALDPADIQRFCANVFMVSTTISLPRVGTCSIDKLQTAVDALSTYLEALLERPLGPNELDSTISLAALVRLQGLSGILKRKKLAWQNLQDHTLIHCMLFDTASIQEAFKSADLPAGSGLFKTLCHICFNNECPANTRQRLEQDSAFILELARLTDDDAAQLLASVHQAHYNIYISGNLKLSHNFSSALASLHKMLGGTYDCFFDGQARYLSSDWVKAFGHLLYLDLLLTAEANGIGPEVPRRIRCTEAETANTAVIELLKENGFEIEVSAKGAHHLARWQMDYIHLPDGRVEHFLDFCNEAQAAQINACQKPFLRLPKSWEAKGSTWLACHNIPQGKKLALIHLREASYWANLHNLFMQSRNVDPKTYVPAISYLLEQGYHVIRLGDASMSQISEINHENFHDLTKVPEKDAFLDYYLLAKADLFIGTTSGPNAVANLFGASCLATNWIPMHVHIPNTSGRVLIMPKLIKAKTGIETLCAMLEDPYSCSEILLSDEFGQAVVLVDNTPDELLAATKELLERHEGCYIAASSSAANAERINRVWRRYMPWDINIPDSFLKIHHRELLGEDQPQ